MLVDTNIVGFIDSGIIRMKGTRDEWFDQIQPISLDVTIGSPMLQIAPSSSASLSPTFEAPVLRRDVVVLGEAKPSYYERVAPFLLLPKAFVLVPTQEHFELPSYLAAKFEMKSSSGRLGLVGPTTGGLVEPGYRGQLTIGIYNAGEAGVWLKEGVRFGQVIFTGITPPARSYGHDSLNSHYQDSEGAVGYRSND